jgi:preprotein translocase subunit SecD
MARRRRPARTLLGFFVGLALAYGLVALTGTWTPTLGLDLQGGTRITLIAEDDPSEDNLVEASQIIDQRVNGSGVSEAEVTTQGDRFVVVEVPGPTDRSLVETVERQAQLRFRVVACTSFDGQCGGVPTTPQQDGGATDAPTDAASPGTGVTVEPTDDASQTPANRAPAAYADRQGDRTGGNNDGNNSNGNNNGGGTTDGGGSTGGDDAPEEAPQPPAGGDYGDPLTWMNSPDQASVQAFQDYTCPPQGETALVEDDPDKPLVTCDDQGVKYLLSVSMIEGTELAGADAGIPQQQIDWVVNLDFDRSGTEKFTEISRALFGTPDLFAIVLDGQVLSAPTMDALITNGNAQISGNFDEESATSLATSLKFGALPIAFEPNPPVETVGPSLAGNQLSAGLVAGGIGLGLVMLYCLLYYRGLGLVVLASLVVAAGATYALVLLLSESANFTLSLPGIAGLIVAVGITADSFIVYFERIRDEMRDGKSMPVAVESGWARARNTCLAADAVSLLAALVLYIFAAGVVKGFAFALGLSTLIDLVVFFWFTHPMVSWLAKYRFFNSGHRFSGLSAETLGIDAIAVQPAGGKA